MREKKKTTTENQYQRSTEVKVFGFEPESGIGSSATSRRGERKSRCKPCTSQTPSAPCEQPSGLPLTGEMSGPWHPPPEEDPALATRNDPEISMYSMILLNSLLIFRNLYAQNYPHISFIVLHRKTFA